MSQLLWQLRWFIFFESEMRFLSSDSSESKTYKSENLDFNFFTFAKELARLAVNAVCVYLGCIRIFLGIRQELSTLASPRLYVAR